MCRIILATLVFKEDYPISDDLIDIQYTCTACGTCNEICQTYRPLYPIRAFREEIAERGLDLMPHPLPEMNAVMAENHNIFGKKSTAGKLEGLPDEGEDVYFAGCYSTYRFPKTARSSVELLKAVGINPAYLGEEEWCCGFVAHWMGDRKLARKMIEHNVEAMKKAGARRVIVSCAHGYNAWKNDYPRYVGELPFRVVHLVEVLAEAAEQDKMDFGKEIKRKMTYHDPCFLGRHGRVYDQPRTVLQAIPGLELAEMERYGKWAYCCGAGAKITLNCYPDFAAQVGIERLREAADVADALVTACPVCYDHLKRTAKNEGVDVEVHDLPLLVAEAMGIKV
jgi:heterodisulfide reductase subunit D